jgi:ABC-2 type transport system ATP-binding protein
MTRPSPTTRSRDDEGVALTPSGPDAGRETIVLSGVSKVYAPTPRWMRVFARTAIRHPVAALDGVDLVVRAGQICAVVGPNGAGKTTLFRIIVGLTTPSSGCGSVLGLDVEHDSERVRRLVGWMPAEDRSLLMRTSCRENLQLHGRLQGMSRRELKSGIPRILETVGISPQIDSIVATLSSGMKARLRLARALLPSPRVLLLDEPTGAVDPIAAHGFLTLITDLVREQGLAVLLSSHRLEEIEVLHSYAVLLDRGRVRYTGDLDELRRTWERPGLELVLATEPAAVRLGADLVATGIDTSVEGCTVRCRLSADAAVGDLLLSLGDRLREVRSVREVPMPLRELIARVYARGQTDRSGV